MGFLNLSQIRSSDYLERREIDATEWAQPDENGKRRPEKILVRQLTAREKDKYENSLVEFKGDKRKVNLIDSRARLAVLCCINEDGTPLFPPDAVEWLTNKPAIVFDRIHEAYEKLNGIRDEDEEDLEKNFE